MNTLPEKIVFPERTLTGNGRVQDLPAECTRFGQRGLIVHGKSLAARGVLQTLLRNHPPGMVLAAWQHAGGEPSLSDLSGLLETAHGHRAEWIAGIGGGSVLDLAKAAAGLCRARGPLAAYHEDAPIETPGVPFIAAPTTAGTGSEATPNAVLTNSDTACKKSIRAADFMARAVILDPELLPRGPTPVIAHAGMDALTQALEAYASRHAAWLSDTLALKAMSLIAKHLEAFYRGTDPRAPGCVLLGSYLAGLAFAMARLGVVHGIAHPLGARYHVPHGWVCGACLPHAVELNRAALGVKYAELGRLFGGDPVGFLRALLRRLDLRSPFAGRPVKDCAAIVRETVGAGSTQANPKPIVPADVEWLLERLFDDRN